MAVVTLRPPAEGSVVRTVGRYEIVGEIGRGGMAVVYVARQTDLDREVALKELASFHAADPAFVERFLREARLAGSLNHPSIVTVHEYFEDDGIPFIAMEHFARGSLRPFVLRLSLPQVAGVLEGLLAGLAHAEMRGVVHRDLKPENVMVTSSGGVKIADFGLAKALQSRPAGSLTATGATVGTPAYMAPEQASGGEVGPWTDLYALGVMTYELLSGRVPFHAEEPAVAVLLRHMNEPIAPLDDVVPDVDSGLSSWVERLLAKEPSKRPAGAAGAWEELEEIVIRLLGPRWRRDAPLRDESANGDAAAALTAVTRGRTPRLPAPTRRRVAWVVGAAALAAVGVAGAISALSLTGGSSKQTILQPTKPFDFLPAPSQRIALASAGNSLFVGDPRGRVIELAPASLAQRLVIADPAGPRSLAVGGDRLYLADGAAVTEYGASDLLPRHATRLQGSWTLAGGSGAPVVAAGALGGRRGRLCEVQLGAELRPCIGLDFAPTGAGASSSSRLVVADRRTGTIVLFLRLGSRLAQLGAPIPVGADPHGTIWSFRDRLYVPVQGGIAVVDPASRRRVRTISLPTTPAASWVVPFGGLLFAALPATGQVAVVDTAFPNNAPLLIHAGGRPVAVMGGTAPEGVGESVFVLGARGAVTRLDPLTGRRLGVGTVGAVRVPPPRRLVLRKLQVADQGDSVVLTLVLAGGHLPRRGLVFSDRTITDGRAALGLWQGGISTATTGGSYGPLSVRVGRAPGRLAVSLRANRGIFRTLRVVRVSGQAVVISLTRPSGAPSTVISPPPTQPGGGLTTTAQTTTTSTPTKPHHRTKTKTTTTTTTTTTQTTPTIPVG
ncbi:MAG: hypothetical protein C5B48_11265 [Candidatus Rokuibacteriota bacterium]|nr:MAG: hypothetical protein C5B48_11265 [Candidatus Rokubacteria bacterium]